MLCLNISCNWTYLTLIIITEPQLHNAINTGYTFLPVCWNFSFFFDIFDISAIFFYILTWYTPFRPPPPKSYVNFVLEDPNA